MKKRAVESQNKYINSKRARNTETMHDEKHKNPENKCNRKTLNTKLTQQKAPRL